CCWCLVCCVVLAVLGGLVGVSGVWVCLGAWEFVGVGGLGDCAVIFGCGGWWWELVCDLLIIFRLLHATDTVLCLNYLRE
ncbi:hypothetical protein, partial [Pseudomonas syringae group genomosp. 7]|uniref:hypothetical protein n=1 Tax=Pseudomonas syringae group genomosp. 7 TaxID=251699 RepID=UPI00376F88FE